MAKKKIAKKKGAKKTAKKKAGNGVAADSLSGDGWLTCAHYQLRVDRTDDIFILRIFVDDESKKRHVLQLDDSIDRPKLAVALFGALQIWPKVNFKFKSDTSKTPSMITEIQ